MISQEKKSENYSSLQGILLVLFLLFVISPCLKLSGITKFDSTSFTLSRSMYWIVVIVLWIYAKKVEKRNLLIWEERKYGIGQYLLSLVGLFGAVVIGILILTMILYLMGVNESSSKISEIINIFKDNHALISLAAITAGVTEELIFRGYIQPRLEVVLKNKYYAIFISSILFGLLHYKYGTIINVLGPFVIGLIFSFYYWKFRNIKVLILFHILWDLMSMYLYLIVSNYHNMINKT